MGNLQGRRAGAKSNMTKGFLVHCKKKLSGILSKGAEPNYQSDAKLTWMFGLRQLVDFLTVYIYILAFPQILYYETMLHSELSSL
jgi:hypothetical protein